MGRGGKGIGLAAVVYLKREDRVAAFAERIVPGGDVRCFMGFAGFGGKGNAKEGSGRSKRF
jgi:hypothetical protein